MLSTLTSSQFLRPPPPPLTVSGRCHPLPSRVKLRTSVAVAQTAEASTCLYEVLRIPMGASGKEIKAAYRRLAMICHPDVAEGSNSDDFVTINAAYSTLSDPDKRADYDNSVFRRLRHHGGGGGGLAAGGFSGYTCRKWETDQCW